MLAPLSRVPASVSRNPVVQALVAADLLRLGALLSLVPAAVGWGLVGFALFLLVLGGTFLPRGLVAPAWLDAAFCSLVLFGAWAALLDWYQKVDWLDLVVHAAVTGLAAALGLVALERMGALPAPLGGVVVALITTSLGTTLAVVWEFGEWFGHTWLDDRIQVGYQDTLADIAAGLVGAAIAGVLLGRRGVPTGETRA